MLENISQENLQREQEILNELFLCIDSKRSSIMNSGAGSGKTFALVECLKYCINKYGKTLKENNQKILCITFTNVAANEIKSRLGNSNITEVSTIHDRLWEIIKPYQKELLKIHSETLSIEIGKMEELLNSDKVPERYLSMSDDEKLIMKEFLINTKAVYYNAYDKKAAEFKLEIETNLPFDSNINNLLLKNVGKFKKLVDTIYKIERFKSCIDSIEKHDKDFQELSYDSVYNFDRLDKMKISHDTVLEYGFKLISQYDILKKIIIDKYPYIFIDEYQDTVELVVKIMELIDSFSKEYLHKAYIGYFGDSAQNIYENGVGAKLQEIHNDCVIVNKEFNRRSCKEIIDVANTIRNDDIHQCSIYDDCIGGTVVAYKDEEMRIDDFIKDISEELDINNSNKLHCLLLTNKTLSKYMGIETLYNSFSKSQYYKTGRNHEQLSSELLSNDIKKLGRVQSLLYNVLSLYSLLKDDTSLVLDIFKRSELSNLTIENLHKSLQEMKGITGDNLLELFTNICNIYSVSNEQVCKSTIETLVGLDNVNIDEIKRFILNSLYPNPKDEEIEEINNKVASFLQISIDECMQWYNYITMKPENDIIYHTFHNTKGLEYDNVVIIMENDFGINKKYFSNYLENVNASTIPENERNKKKYFEAQNLLYVSVTRAIKNLRVLYVGDISTNAENGLRKIFGEIITYKEEQ
jgi:DNA helicase-2/ATP-dependent DNA helicase PcrA